MLNLAFLNPWALWLLPLAAVPIIIHLLNRRRFNTVKWAAMSFLLSAMKRNRRRMQMEQWLILALRTLGVLLLVLLVSRPRFEDIALGTAQRHHVVVIDDSASMAQRGATTSAFDDAVKTVTNTVSDLGRNRSGDLLTVVLGSELDQPLLSAIAISSDTDARLRSALAGLEVGDGRFDVATALTAASARASDAEGTDHITYHVITDGRAHDWLNAEGEAQDAAQKWMLERNADREHVSIVTVGPRDPSNIAITALRCRDRVATTGLPITFRVEVSNNGTTTSTGGTLNVEVDQRSRTSYPVPPLTAGESTTIEFAQRFRTPGAHGVTASLEQDRFAIDDTRALAIEVRDSSRVLIVDGDPGDTLEESETYFLHAALEIRGMIDSGIAVRLIGDHELGDFDDAAYAEFDMIWLCNVARPDSKTCARLETFVRNGGGLVTYLGNQIDLGYYNEALFRGGDGILPSRLLELAGDLDEPTSLHLADKDDPLFADNTEDTEFLLERMVQVGRYVAVDEAENSTARALLRVRDEEGPPFLVAKDIGEGRSYLVTSTADAEWNSMPLAPVFVLTSISMHRNAARPQDFASRNLTPEGSAAVDLDLGRHARDLTVTRIDDALGGDVRTFSMDTTETTGADAPASLQVPMTELDGYGLFQVDLRRHDGGSDRQLLSRNAHIGEGELGKLSAEAFRRSYAEEIADRVSYTVQSTGSDGGTASAVDAGDASDGRTWRFAGLVMLIGMLLETLLAWRFGRR